CVEGAGAGGIGSMVYSIEHGAAAVRWPQSAFSSTCGAIPQQYITGLLLGQVTDDLMIQINANYAGEAQGFVVGKLRRTEGIPGEYKPLGQWVKGGLP